MGCHCKLDDDQLRYYRHFVPLALETFGDLPWPEAEPCLASAWVASGVPIEWEDVRWAIRSRWGSARRDLAAMPSDEQLLAWGQRVRVGQAGRGGELSAGG